MFVTPRIFDDHIVDLDVDRLRSLMIKAKSRGCVDAWMALAIQYARACNDEIDRLKDASILQPWVQRLGLRHQGVLMSCVRGCDSVPKEDATKALVRCFRAMVLRPYDMNPSSFIENVDGDTLKRRMEAVLKNHDHYPIHYLLHLMYGSEIIGYKAVEKYAPLWRWFYFEMCRKFHLTPETEIELDARLNASEEDFAEGV